MCFVPLKRFTSYRIGAHRRDLCPPLFVTGILVVCSLLFRAVGWMLSAGLAALGTRGKGPR